VIGKTLPNARIAIVNRHCKLGSVRKAYSHAKKGRVAKQDPRAGSLLRRGGKVNLVVSRGRRVHS
jgi:beta-lactam-binding protein with PASTA domain